MKHALFAATLLAGMMAIGCDDKNEQKAATPETDKAAEKVADKGVDVAQGVDKSIKGGTDQMKANVDKNSAQAVDAENLRGNMMDLTGKLKKALEEKKFDEAQTFVQQLKDLKPKLPADAQTQVDQQLAEADKLISAGKALMNPAGK
jgi:hypothetical protein